MLFRSKKAHDTDAGYDCFISQFARPDKDGSVTTLPDQKLVLKHGERILCQLGFATKFPTGYYAQLCPRSGLALKKGLMTIIGTIDAGYRGEWGAIVVNLGDDTELELGMKICQFIFKKIDDVIVKFVHDLSMDGDRQGGFGSTGH